MTAHKSRHTRAAVGVTALTALVVVAILASAAPPRLAEVATPIGLASSPSTSAAGGPPVPSSPVPSSPVPSAPTPSAPAPSTTSAAPAPPGPTSHAPSASSAAPTRQLPATTAPPAAGCAATSGAFTPTRMVVDRLRLSIPVLAMPLTADGLFPVPPPRGPVDPKWSAAWWRDGARPGSGRGVAHLDVHTWTSGGAAGNLLGQHARPGDVVKLIDHLGRVGACYRIERVETWTVSEVVARLDQVSRTWGPPGLAIEFCWEAPQRWGDHQWRLRRYLIGTTIA